MAIATLLFSTMALWTSPARAGIKCTSYTVRNCNDYVCCYQTCAYCFDTITGEILSENCTDPDCYEKAV